MSQLEGLAEPSPEPVVSVWGSAQLHSPPAGRWILECSLGGINEAEVCKAWILVRVIF